MAVRRVPPYMPAPATPTPAPVGGLVTLRLRHEVPLPLAARHIAARAAMEPSAVISVWGRWHSGNARPCRWDIDIDYGWQPPSPNHREYHERFLRLARLLRDQGLRVQYRGSSLLVTAGGAYLGDDWGDIYAT